MSHIDLIEAQKRREATWVDASAAAFLRRVEANDAALSPGGRALIKGSYEALCARLDRFVAETSATQQPMASTGFAVIMMLGTKQVAAIVLHVAVEYAMGLADRDPRYRTVLVAGQQVARALEHDLLFRAWREAGAHDLAVQRMREAIQTGGRQTWSSRIKTMERLATIEWSKTDLAVTGMDLLYLLVDACPETFVASNVRIGEKTVKLLDLTQEASERLELDTQRLAIGSAALGLMLVPPLPWRYQ